MTGLQSGVCEVLTVRAGYAGRRLESSRLSSRQCGQAWPCSRYCEHGAMRQQLCVGISSLAWVCSKERDLAACLCCVHL